MHLYTTDANNLIMNKKSFVEFINSNSWNIFQENWIYCDEKEERPIKGIFLFISNGGARYHVVLEMTWEGGVRITWTRTNIRPRGVQKCPTWHHPARYTPTTKEVVLKRLEKLHIGRDMSYAACSFLGIDD